MNDNNNNNNNNQKEEKEIKNKESHEDNNQNNNENDNNYIDKESEEELDNNELNQILSLDEKRLSSKKLEQLINLDTVVYEIYGFGESRIKDYGKISAEIKQVEQLAKTEKAKLKKKIMQMNKRLNDTKEANLHNANKNEENNDENVQNKLLNLQSKKLMMMEFERDKKFNFIEVIQKLKILPEKRTIRDILRIKTYISQSKLGLSFKDEFTDISIVEKLIHFCCIEMRYKKIKRGDISFMHLSKLFLYVSENRYQK